MATKRELEYEATQARNKVQKQQEVLPLILVIWFDDDFENCDTFAMRLDGPLTALFKDNVKYVEYDGDEEVDSESNLGRAFSYLCDPDTKDRIELQGLSAAGFNFYGVFRVNLGPY